MTDRIVATIVAASVYVLAGISVGCGDSPASPTPAPIAPTPASTPAPVVLAVTSMTPSSGPSIGGDDVRINGTHFQPGVTVMFDDVVVSIMSATSTLIRARTPRHPLGTVDVAVMNPDGETVRLKAA